MPSTSDLAEQFMAWPLHDAVLQAIRVDWQARTCVAHIDAFVARDKDAVPRELVWRDIHEVHIPYEEPWGRSVSINEAKSPGHGVFVLQMQSGDEIRIRADHVELVTPET